MLLKFTVKAAKGAQVEQIEALQKKLFNAKGLNTAVGKAFEKTLRTHFRSLDRRPNKRGWKKSHFWQKIASDTVFAGADESKAVVAIGNSSGSKLAAKVFGARIRPKSGKKFLAIPAIEARYGVSPSSLDKNELQFRRTRKGGLLGQIRADGTMQCIIGSSARPTRHAIPTRFRRKKPYWTARKNQFLYTLKVNEQIKTLSIPRVA